MSPTDPTAALRTALADGLCCEWDWDSHEHEAFLQRDHCEQGLRDADKLLKYLPLASQADDPSGPDALDVEAAWDSLSEAMEVVSLSPVVDEVIARHRPLIEAAIRAALRESPNGE